MDLNEENEEESLTLLPILYLHAQPPGERAQVELLLEKEGRKEGEEEGRKEEEEGGGGGKSNTQELNTK